MTTLYRPPKEVAWDEKGFTEWRSTFYFSFLGYWIGLNRVWARDPHGRLCLSPMNTRMMGLRYIRIPFFEVTIYKIR